MSTLIKQMFQGKVSIKEGIATLEKAILDQGCPSYKNGMCQYHMGNKSCIIGHGLPKRLPKDVQGMPIDKASARFGYYKENNPNHDRLVFVLSVLQRCHDDAAIDTDYNMGNFISHFKTNMKAFYKKWNPTIDQLDKENSL